MKKLLYGWLIALAISGFDLKAQYGNEWIDHSQYYVKFPVHKEGIYRIDSVTLAKHFDLSTLDPARFQLFLLGKEQFLFVEGGSDGKINTNDFLEFYARPEIGKVDSLVYSGIKYLPNPYGPLFNDTIYGFLTTNSSVNNKRYQLETDTNSAAYPLADYFYTNQVYSVPFSYNQVKEHFNSVSDPRYTQAEGKGSAFASNTSVSQLATNFGNLLNYKGSALPFYVTVNYSGASENYNVSPDHHITVSYTDVNNNPVKIGDTLFAGWQPVRQVFNLNTQNVSNASNFTIAALPTSSASSNNILHYLEICYPQIPHLNSLAQYKVITHQVSSAKTFYNFSNFNPLGAGRALLLDITNGKKIQTVLNGNFVRAVIPNNGSQAHCYLATEAATIGVTQLTKVNGTGTFSQHLRSVNKTPYLLIYHPSLKSSATSYMNYRSSVAGGNFEVFAASTEELYEQFSFGVNKHPVALRNYIRYLQNNLSIEPAYVLLFGKGIKLVDINPSRQYVNLVPTMGIPSSDNLLVTDLNSSPENRQTIPIGRIAAVNNAKAEEYLIKVQQHESTGKADWKKRVLHFVGGGSVELSTQLSAYMSSYETTIEDTLFGAQVFTFKKNSTLPVQSSISDSIIKLINEGAALINVFGHGSAEGFDVAVDNTDLHNNVGKYPFIIANSCYSGDIFIEGSPAVAERFVFAEQKGSIGFIASTSIGYDYSLNDFTSHFYRSLSRSRYGRGIGDVIKEAAEKNALSPDPMTSLVGFDMALHGDPAIKIYNGLQPDYVIRNQDVRFDLVTHPDSLGIEISIKNAGMAVRDSFMVRIVRTYANGDSMSLLQKIRAPLYRDTLKKFVFIDFNRGLGLNKIAVSIDDYSEITESDETNNTTIGTVDVFIPGGDLLPVYPYKYAIVPKQDFIILKASTTDPFAPSAAYRMQLDTCDRFTAPVASTLITSTGGVLEWKVSLPFKDSTVYFWRVSRDSVSPQKPVSWKESSFQTIGAREGWSQAHFHQFKQDKYQFVKYKYQNRQFIFENDLHAISCINGIYPYFSPTGISYFFDNEVMSNWGCSPDGWNIAVFDSISGLPFWDKSTGNAPGVNEDSACFCVPRPLPYFAFGRVNACGVVNWKQPLEKFLNNIAPNNYVLAWTVGAQSGSYAAVSSYPSSLYAAFETIGAKTIRSTSDTVPYILFGRKGMKAGEGNEVKGTNIKSVITLNDAISTRWHSGYIASELIGPSHKWNSLHWKVKSMDPGAGDTTHLKIVGVRHNGQRDTLAVLPGDSTDISLAAYIDASVYPYMELVAFMKDNRYRTPAQMERWQVLYEEAPECALNPLKGFASLNDSLQEGEELKIRVPIENIGRRPFGDSLVVTYWLEDNQRNKIELPHKLKKAGFSAGEIIFDTISISSMQLLGNNGIWISVNPVAHERYQPEQYHFNNIGRHSFKVDADRTNPLLDVTFDGVRILNGDIVSAKPEIIITLKDENKFLALNDTSAFTVFLQSPENNKLQRLHFNRDLHFTPATLPKNSASIRYAPEFRADGRYMLSVQARDRSNNISGSNNYQVQFEVFTRPSVTEVLNYPNPFTTRTRFVFTLTGSEIPEVFTIQIMTITGKIVREITRAELGPIRIGRNITEYAWDGRDNYGDRLANGVYLYRVITRLNGQTIENKQTSASKYFVKEFGKMVLMR